LTSGIAGTLIVMPSSILTRSTLPKNARDRGDGPPSVPPNCCCDVPASQVVQLGEEIALGEFGVLKEPERAAAKDIRPARSPH
jgi:hypothetical protein